MANDETVLTTFPPSLPHLSIFIAKVTGKEYGQSLYATFGEDFVKIRLKIISKEHFKKYFNEKSPKVSTKA